MNVRTMAGVMALVAVGTVGCHQDGPHKGENSPGSFSDKKGSVAPAAPAAAAAAAPTAAPAVAPAGAAAATPAPTGTPPAATPPAATPPAATPPAAGVAAAPAAGAGSPTDTTILAVLHEANEAEIAAARVALDKSTNARVQSFAHEMIHDHARMDRQGALVASALNVTPIPLANDSLAAHLTEESAQLSAAAQGPAFDKAYIDAQVQDHETVLALLQRFQPAAQHDAVKTTITDAMPVVQKHLDQARAIQVRLNGSSSMALAPAP